ncbi:MAG TPA: amino acid adenylation domain-containing protein, partial [Thermoanaerobaculia bacterium]
MLSRLSGATDLAVGVPAQGRPGGFAETVGYFVNPLVLRSDLFGDPSFAAALSRTREALIGALEHQEMPLPELALRLRASGRTEPPFRTMLVVHRAPSGLEGMVPFALGEAGGRLAIGGMEFSSLALPPRSAQFDLTLTVGEREGKLGGALTYNAALFEGTTVERLAEQLGVLLEGAMAAPEVRLSELPLLTAAARQQLAVEANDRAEPEPEGDSIEQGFERQALLHPERTAVVCGVERTTYAELNHRANQLARHLVKLGAGAESLVAVCLPRTTEMVSTLLAVLKTGAAYVPLDPGLPEERRALLLADSGASIGVTREGLLPSEAAFATVALDRAAERLASERGDDLTLAHPGGSRRLAYVIYTSGSTGVPKGVGIEHASALRLLAWAGEAFSAEELSGVLAGTSIGFDLSIFELFAPLTQGGTVILADSALGLAGHPAASSVRLVNTVPSAMSALLDIGALPAGVRTVNLAGEPLRRSLAERVHAAGVGRLLNLYGPSEDTTYSTGGEVAAGESGEPSIGRPLAGSRAYVVDAALQLVPFGVAGELCLGGGGLARGYLGRPELTAERFVPDAFSGAPGGRLYRTGDRVRQRPDGAFEYLGRLDRQLKIRGFRVEPGEIETALLASGLVREAAVVRPDGADALAAYVTAGAEAGANLAETLLVRLRRRLPSALVPASLAVRDALPLTPNGKVDRRALSRLAVGALDEEAVELPSGEVEERLAAIWRELLGESAAGRIGRTSRFFDLGGHSLSAARLLARVRAELGVDLPLAALFESADASRLLELARRIEAERREIAPIRIEPRPEGAAPVLSFAQERLWFLEQLAPGHAVYNMPVGLWLDGPLDVAALAGALTSLVSRHEALRTVVEAIDGDPVARLLPQQPVELPVADLSDAGDPTAMALSWAAGEAARPFTSTRQGDLASEPLLRAGLARLADTRHLLVLVLHHIAADGWSLGIVARELSAGYAALSGGAMPTPEPLPIQYSDYAVWQRAALSAGALAAEVEWWRERLAGLPPVVALPSDRPRPPVQSFAGGNLAIDLSLALTADLARLAAASGATLFMALLAGLSALLSRLSAEQRVAIGTAVANRTPVETEPLIGLFVNSLALSADAHGDPDFRTFLARTRAESLAAFAHRELPYEKLVEALAPVRALSHAPLFQVMLTFEAELPELALPRLAVRRQPLATGTARLDLLFTLHEAAGRLAGELEYSRDLFDAPTAQRLVAHLEQLLAAAAA